jgi:RNA polymerase sigma factor (sigma-70 family)
MEGLPEDLEEPGPVEPRTKKRRTAIVAVRQAMKLLSETDQLILRLRHLEEHRSFKEIAEILGIDPGASRTRHSRALKHLGDILKQDDRVIAVLRKINETEAQQET